MSVILRVKSVLAGTEVGRVTVMVCDDFVQVRGFDDPSEHCAS